MTTIGVYIGTESDGTKQLFDKQPWEQYFAGYTVQAFGSSTLPDSVSEFYHFVPTTPRSPENPFNKIVSAFLDCREYLEQRNPDVVFQLMRYPTHAPGVAYACHLNNTPAVTRYMGDDFNEFRIETGMRKLGTFFLGNVLGRIPLKYSDKMICFGPYSRKLLMKRGYSPKNLVNIPPSIRPSEDFTSDYNQSSIRADIGLPEEKTVVLYTGRLTNKKGMEFLRKTVELIDDDILFVLAGKGPYASSFRTQFDSESVQLPGYIPYEEIHTYYKAADGYVHPSPYEGIPLSILEALECGTPVLARRAGDIPFVTPNIVDTPKEMAEMIEEQAWDSTWLNEGEFDIQVNKQKVKNMVEDIVIQ